MSEHAAAPVKIPFLSKGTWFAIILAVIGMGAYMARMVVGMGPMTNLSDTHPWGIWIAIDVATGVALAAGGFTSSALVYVFGHEKYHALIRPALLTAMLGYTFVVIGLLADLGRYYNLWHPLLPSMWQGNSVLFEVGICVSIYLNVLYLEFVPIAVERFMGRVALPGPLKAFNGLAEALLRFADRTVGKVQGIFIVAGICLSCLHQSSLGALMTVAPSKVSPIWYTPVLPALFLMSAMAVGLPMIIFEGTLAAKAFKLPSELPLYKGLARIISFILGMYAIAKAADMTIRDAWHHVLQVTPQTLAFWAEVIIGIAIPLVMFLTPRVRRSSAGLFVASACVVLGVALNRINVFLVSYKPPFTDATYFPSIFEVLVTVGLIALLVLVYRAFVLIFPIVPPASHHHVPPSAAPAHAGHAAPAKVP